MRVSRIVSPAIGLSLCAAAIANPAEGYRAPTLSVPAAASAVSIDGVVDEPAWDVALRLALDYEVRPGENVPPPVRTDLFVTYDEGHMLFAFRAHDPEPSKIRARYSDRDRAWDDDWVGIVIDTFNDERRAYEMLSNPLGVQIDAINDEVGGNYDTAWDAIWDSAGRITDEGFEVEIAIPFHQIRFQSLDGEQTWGFDAIRSYPRGDRHHIGLFPRDRNKTSYLSQTVKLSGMSGASPGKNLEITPTATGSRTDSWDAEASGPRRTSDSSDLGVTLRWGVTPNVTLNGTYNPDFSQVEADAVQLDINQQFALFFREKRPFFLESSDFFNTQLGLLHTRTVADPLSAVKTTGKTGRHTFGAFVARDRQTDMIFPGAEGSSGDIFANLENTATVARYRYDFGSNSTVGGMITDRRGGEYANQVVSADLVYRITDADTIDFSLATSRTEYSQPMIESAGVGSQTLEGDALALVYHHGERGWWTRASYSDYGDEYRSDMGFRPRVGFRQWIAGGARVWWGEEGDFFRRIGFGGDVDRTVKQNGDLLEEEIETWLNLDGPTQSFLYVGFGLRNRTFEGVEYDQRFVATSFNIRPSAGWFVALGGEISDWIDFANSRAADRWNVWTELSYNFGRHLRVDYSHSYRELDVAGGRLFRVQVPEARIVHQFNTRAFVRAILQYTDIRRNPDLYLDEVEAETRDFLTQLLFSYKVNPQTALYVGYTDRYFGNEQIDLTRTDRTLFLKLGYAWVP